jgi:transglutaminase-like putative cysteine protease
MKRMNDRLGDLLTHFILGLAILIISWRLESTNWVPGLDRIGWLIAAGYSFGVLLGISNFRSSVAVFLSLCYTVLGVTWQALTLIEGITYTLRNSLEILWRRVSISFYQFVQNLPVEDPVLFYYFLGILLWLTSVSASFLLIRKKSPWIPLLIFFIYLLLIDYFPPYAERPGKELGLFIFLSLIIVGRIWYLRSWEQWLQNGYRIDSETGFHVLRSIAMGSFVIVIFAWNISIIGDLFKPGSVSRTQVSESWIDFRTRVSNLFASIEAPFLSATDYYEDSMRLGVNVPVGYETLFLVQVPDRDERNLRFYWRGHSFDLYRNGEWINTINQREQRYGNLLDEQENPYAGRTPISLEFELRAGVSRTLYLPFLPGSVDRQVSVVGYEKFEESNIDMMSVLPITPLKRGDIYAAEVFVSQPTIRQLREAGTNYPDWIIDHYLKLPENFPTRIQQLASAIVEDADNPYDQAAAITRYLRTEIAYEPLLSNPPQNREPIDWMLFDSKIGFCNYYATAEVLMLRSIGVPARFAAGYAQGEPVGDTTFNVRARDSHAWPEVFFPGIGWVEFEPTTAQPVRDLPLGETILIPRSPAASDTQNEFSRSEPPKDIDAFLDVEEGGSNPQSKWIGILPWLWILIPLFMLGVIYLVNRFILMPQKRTIAGVLTSGVEKVGFETPGWLVKWDSYALLSHIQKTEAQFSLLSRLIDVPVTSDQTLNEKYEPIKKLIPDLADAMDIFIFYFNENQYRDVPIDKKLWSSYADTVRREYLRYWFMVKLNL